MIKKPLMQQHQGFSLVELVSVIILLGILSAYIAPKFFSRDGFSEYAIRDQIVAAARIAQQRAMYDHSSNACYRLSIYDDAGQRFVAAQRLSGGGYLNFGPTQSWVDGIVIDGATVAATTIYFDGLGSPLSNIIHCAGVEAQSTITVLGASTLNICLYTSGYIRAQSC